MKNELRETKRLIANVNPLLFAFFVLSLVLMNLLANKSLETHVSWLALDGGLLVSWLTFLTMDIVVKVYGPKDATRLSIVATGVNLVVCGIFAVAASIPGVWSQAFIGENVNEAIDATFAGAWYVLLGSTIAFIVSVVVNNVLNWLVGKMFSKTSFIEYATRSYISTMIAQFVDNLVFALLVSLNFFGWTLTQCMTCALAGAIVELLCEILFSPIGYVIARNMQNKQSNTKD